MERFEQREAELRFMSFLNWMNQNEYGVLGVSDGGIELFDARTQEPMCIIKHDGYRWRATEKRTECNCCSEYYAGKHKRQTENIGFGPELPTFRELFSGVETGEPNRIPNQE